MPLSCQIYFVKISQTVDELKQVIDLFKVVEVHHLGFVGSKFDPSNEDYLVVFLSFCKKMAGIAVLVSKK